MSTNRFLLIAATTLCSWAAPALAQPAESAPGAKIDSGLGELPHYRLWLDPTGRDPMGLASAEVARTRQATAPAALKASQNTQVAGAGTGNAVKTAPTTASKVKLEKL